MADKLIIKIKQGEALSYNMSIKADGSPLDLSNRTIVVEAKTAPFENVEPMFRKEITTTSDLNTVGQITDPLGGQFQVMFTKEDTSYPVDEYCLVLALSDGITYDIISSKCCGSGQYIICAQ